MKMKRLLALLLCVTQLVGFVPHVHAEEATPSEIAECEHDWQQYDYAMGVCSYKDNGNGTHTETISGSVEYYKCVLCKETKQETVDETGRAPHEYGSDGACVCGAVKPSEGCTEHTPYMDHENPHFGTSTGEYINKYLQDVHQHKYNCTFDQYCSTCGELLEANAGTGTSVKYEPHVWSNGKCTLCGYSCEHSYSSGVCTNCGAAEAQATCDHPAEKLTEPDDNNRFKKNEGVTDITETHHTRTYEVWGYFTCECGATGLERQIVANGSTKEVHNFRDGVCVTKGCGVAEPHKHEYVMSGGYTYTVDYEKTADTHTKTTTYTYEMKCACGEKGEDQVEVVTDDPAAHSYENGECACGAKEAVQNVCEYCGSSNTIETLGTTNYSWEKIDDAQHKESFDRAYFRECKDCGKRSVASIIESVKDQVAAHYFIDGVCGCGATSACQHENTETYEAFYSLQFEYVDKTYHIMSYKIADRTVCLNEACGEELAFEDTGRTGSSQETHTFTNGKCLCGAEESESEECTHPNSKKLNEWYALVSGSWTNNNNGTHTGNCVLVAWMECSDCGELYEASIAGEEAAVRTINCWRWNGETGLCAECGYPIGVEGDCDHDWKQYDYVQGVCSYKDNGNGTHTETILGSTEYYRCSLCEETKENTVDESGVWPHEYDANGVCIKNGCGAVKPSGECTEHNEYVDRENPIFGTSTGRYENPGIADVHKQIYNCTFNKICTICGENLGTTEGNAPQYEPHVFDNGVCGLCGYVCKHTESADGKCTNCGVTLGCQHPNIQVSNTYYQLVTGSEWISNNNGTHTGKAVKVNWWYCDECSYGYEEEIEDPIDNYTENCDFEDGVCVRCDYKSSCAHENRTLEGHNVKLAEGTNWESRNNAENHFGTGYQQTFYICDDCGESITETDTELKDFVLPHNYLNGIGACSDCGYTNTCEHPEEKLNVWYELVLAEGEQWTTTETTHTGVSKKIAHYFCNECEAYWEESEQTAKEQSGEHSMENGKCSVCGYENTCEHPADQVNSWTYYSLIVGGAWVDNGNGTHTGEAYKHEAWECYACGEVKDTHTDPQKYTLDHDYVSDVCIYCDAEKPACDHSAGGTRTDEYEMNFAAPIYQDEEFHLQPYTVTFKYRCNTCGELYDGTPNEMEGLGGHDYEADGKCACGAEGTYTGCTHENTEFRYCDENVVYSDIMESTHTKTADVYFYSWCLDCETRRTYQLDTPDVVTTEAHSYEASEPVVTESYDVTADGHAVITTTATTYTCVCGLSYEKKESVTGNRVAHDFTTGECVCGEECPHDHRYPDEDNMTDKVLGAASQYTEEESPARHEVHKRAYTAKTNILCEVCGATVETGKQINGYESELHAWVDGVCSACGYVCDHEFKGGICANCEYECPHASYTDGACDVCDVVCAHEKFADGKCSVCGLACDHAEGYDTVETGREYTKYEPYTADQNAQYQKVHKAYYTIFRSHSCLTCGKELSTSTFDDYMDQDHTLVNGKCSVCGWECAHDSYTDSECDVCGVKCTHENYVDGICGECGLGCAHENYTNGTCDVCGVKCAHDDYTNGVCDECGVKCAHEDYSNGVCDECGVECAHEAYTQGICDVCGMECPHEHYTGSVCDECGSLCMHDGYIDGVCGECGTKCEHAHYTSGMCDVCGTVCKHPSYAESKCSVCGEACKHEDRFETDPFYEYPVNASWTDAGDGTHTITVREVFNWECLDCGVESFEVVNETVQLSEPHDWSNEDSVCAVCDCECEHENLEIMEYDRIVSAVTPYDSTSCTWTVDVYEETWCEDCLVKIGEKLVSEGEARFEEHSSEDGDYICDTCGYQMPVPTPTPAPVVTPAPTRRPTTGGTVITPTATPEPTVEPTEAPTVEPTVEPTPAPVTNEMISTLVESVAAAEEEGSVVTIEVVGAQEVFTEEDHEQLKELPVAEQILVTLSTIGFGDVVEAAMASMNVTLSENAAQLVTKANETMSQMPEEERKVMQETIEKNFPKTQVQIDGVVYDYFILNLEIVVDGVARIESYGFRFDEELGQWIFVKMDTLETETNV